MRDVARTPPRPLASPLRRLCAWWFVLATAGCASVTAMDAQRPDRSDAVSTRAAGSEVAQSAVRVPSTVPALATLHGRAPPASIVETDSQRLTVGDDGRFELKAPAEGTWTIRVRRPAPLTPLRFNVVVIGGQPD
ncbi:hypothetical protein [Luteimonas sp. 3794]|uniref:hypothetical protein n=1 Tax=Luteimonas sp. 3794 TaxID=2817730 RepID=UPI002862E2A1|nr:hypothetical protein [Luteimonas sp. 3794]MDR6990792.1 hypothetical protein [Luteimonas sp. 3794]